MQRTAVVYGLALSTLAGAFLLAPRQKPVPVPVPEPVARVDEPLTELVYADGTLEVIARLDRGYQRVGDTEPVWMDVAVKASGVGTRAPLTSVLVIDRSGSMAGDKIEAARMAAERYVKGLRDGDALGVVTFGTDTTLELPVTVMDDATRAQALDVVRRLEEGGGTNIDGGLTAARQLLKNADLAGRVGRVVLLSDGRPTEGDRREATLAGHAQELRKLGVVTSTLGLGLDYNEDLMERVAVDGGGRYHYMRHGSQLPQIMSDELDQASAVIATGVTLHLPTGLDVADVPGSRFERGEHVRVDVGDLAAGEERHVLVKLVGPPRERFAFAAPEVVYRKVAERSDSLLAHRADAFRILQTSDASVVDVSRRADVRVRVLQVEASLAMTESMRAYASGDAAGARARLEAKKSELKEVAARTKSDSLAAEAANFDKVLDVVNAAPAPASESSQDLIKDQKARAFQMRR